LDDADGGVVERGGRRHGLRRRRLNRVQRQPARPRKFGGTQQRIRVELGLAPAVHLVGRAAAKCGPFQQGAVDDQPVVVVEIPD